MSFTTDDLEKLKRQLVGEHGAPPEILGHAVREGTLEGGGIRVGELEALPKDVSKVPEGGWWIEATVEMALAGVLIVAGWDPDVQAVAYARMPM